MEKILEKLFDLKKIPTKLILVICISSGIILFAPDNFIEKLQLEEFIKSFGKFIGISFIISLSFTLIALWNYLSFGVKKKRLTKKIEQKILSKLNRLTLHEKALLREFYINSKTTLQLPIDDETVVSLSNNNIIYQATDVGSTYLNSAYFAFSITEFAQKNITSNMINLPENPSEEEIRYIKANRPEWVRERNRFNLFD